MANGFQIVALGSDPAHCRSRAGTTAWISSPLTLALDGQAGVPVRTNATTAWDEHRTPGAGCLWRPLRQGEGGVCARSHCAPRNRPMRERTA